MPDRYDGWIICERSYVSKSIMEIICKEIRHLLIMIAPLESYVFVARSIRGASCCERGLGTHVAQGAGHSIIPRGSLSPHICLQIDIDLVANDPY